MKQATTIKCRLAFMYVSLLLIFSFAIHKGFAQNAIVTENLLTGNPKSEWDLPNPDAGDLSIQGFATDLSYNKGSKAFFKIKTDASAYTIAIYRLGYYAGLGARKWGDAIITAALPQLQPDCFYDPATGLTDCGNWAVSAEWQIPANAVSGIYLAKLTRTDTGGASHIVFIVRDDTSNSDLLFQTSDGTWQAYNGYGGADGNTTSSLYVGSVAGMPSGHASKVSYNRPFFTRAGNAGGGAQEDWLFNCEYPMLRFLEKNGYDVTYTTNIDTDRNGSLILNHKVFMSVGHDEYWSKGMRDNVEAARDAGVHLAFFSGNEVYWKTRYENSYDGTNTAYRTLVCYKEGPGGENTTGTKSDPTPEWTGLWRYGCAPTYDPISNNACKPENELTGQISWIGTTRTISVPSEYGNLRFWKNTAVATLGNGQSLSLTPNTLGYEWNPYLVEFKNNYPKGLILLSRTEADGNVHHLSLYKHSSGAWVFGAGTVQWMWGLDDQHDRGNEPVSPDMQQATVNLLAEMDAQPTTLQNNLVLATKSTDTQAPTVNIIYPTNGASISSNLFAITGTATDLGGGAVAGIEVSFDGGTTWNVAEGTASWTYDISPTTTGALTIKIRAFDDSGNMSVPSEIDIFLEPPICPCSLFKPTDSPAQFGNDGNPLEVGFKFKSTKNGYITALRFYKKQGSGGTYTGNLWDASGNNLVSIVFPVAANDFGWQEAQLPAPVQINANTTYIASYHSSSGDYALTNPYFTQDVVNGDLVGLANNNINGVNGVYKYSNTPTFPTENWQTSNYWADVAFTETLGPDNTPPQIVLVSPSNGASGIAVNTSISATFNENIDENTISNQTFILKDNNDITIFGTTTYNANSQRLIFTPDAPLEYNITYTAKVKGGSQEIADLAGNNLSEDYIWSFTTAAPPPPLPTEGFGGPILVLSSSANPFSSYPVEILRAEGLNEFDRKDISDINSSILSNYEIIILGNFALNASQVNLLSDWTNAGGTLIAFKPDNQLANLLGITFTGNTLSEKYLKIDNNSSAGTGIVNETMQFHGIADLYTLNGATALATLYNDANNASAFPAITLKEVGTNGGQAIAFAFDLARSIVYTRQGNPDWEGQKRDESTIPPIRSNDLFFGNNSADPQPDWIDLNKVQIPQADEQQRFLANLIIQGNMDKKPLPRLWYLPRKLKAAVVMTGDDHASGGTIGRFDQYYQLSGANNSPEAVEDWLAIRGTSYIYPNTPITDAQISDFQSKGFEIAIHLNTNCANWTPASLRNFFDAQLAQLSNNFPSILPTITHRTHCIAWSDFASKPKVQKEKGIRLDANYYYWPGSWINDRPGLFTGSGIPMRFADKDGTLIDCYQVTTQMTDESGITYANHISTLLDNAVGTKGYYSVICANMHTDVNGGNSTQGSDAIIAAAQARNVPVISARQLLKWLDGRDGSYFTNFSWANNILNFNINVGAGAHKMYGMLPYEVNGKQLLSLTLNAGNVSFDTEVIKGIKYAFFPADAGAYQATYDNLPLIISTVTSNNLQETSATITWASNKNANSTVVYGTAPNQLSQTATDNALVTNHTITLNNLSPNTTYYFRVISEIASPSESATFPVLANSPLSFTTLATPAPVCFTDESTTDFSAGTADANTLISNGKISLKPAVFEEFNAMPSPSAWNTYVWHTGGGITVANGVVSVDGARFNTEPETTTFGAGTSLEFIATFGNATFQHVGFGGGANLAPNEMFNTAPWAVFSTGNSTSVLKARVWDGGSFLDTDLSGSFLGSSHLYKIVWTATGFEFYIDNVLKHTQNTSISTPMRVGISDYSLGGADLKVDWVKITPYASESSFTSRIYDAGSAKDWQQVSWTENKPNGTDLQIFQRQGNTPTPDASWSAFTQVSNNANVGGTARYIQYRADFSTTNTAISPVLDDIHFACNTPATAAPLVITHPTNQIICEGENVSFTSSASGIPSPTVQWQVSTNGTDWADIEGATNPTLSLTVTLADNNNQYKAVWTNTQGTATSDPAILTVNPSPNATLVAVNAEVCQGQNIELQLANTTGTAPYTLVVNGITYQNVSAGQTFATLLPLPTQSIFTNTAITGNLNANDGQAIELGLKFRSSASGYVKGVKFYKGIGNNGTHKGRLWKTDGTLLADATFTDESVSGWQTVLFNMPVFIQANTTYLVSYFSQDGGFAIQTGFFNNGNSVTNGVLTALSNGTDGNNSVYKYGGGFPDSNGNGASYWVDVVFEELITSPQTLTFTLENISNASACNSGNTLNAVNVIVNPMPNGTLSATPPIITQGQNANLTFTALAGTNPFALTINGITYNNISSGIPFAVNIPTLNTPTPQSIWSENDLPATPSSPSDQNAVELGTKFRSAVAGKVKGIKFYKGANNTGTHEGHLWTGTGTLLGSVTFTNETATGWQTANFTTPIDIEANTTYVISYHAPNGGYAYNLNYFTNAVNSGVLTALANGTDGANGVYIYGTSGSFPTDTYQNSNYWVDVVFIGEGQTVNYNLTQIIDAKCTSNVNVNASLLVKYQLNATATPQNVTCVGQSNGAIGLTVSGGFAPYTFLWNNGATTQDLNNIPAQNYNVTITDAIGLTKIVNVSVGVIPDTENPVLVGVPSDVILTCGQAVPTAPTVTATDNCSATVTFAETQNGNVITRTWTATDGANNQVSQSQNITLVADTENPVLVGVPSDVSLTCGQAVPTAPTVTATDNCSATVTFAETQNGNVITRTWTATDGANNQVSQSQNITLVADTENPVLVGVPSDVSLTCGQAVPTAPTVTATDNCGATVTFAETQNGNVITRTWTATDGANNQVSQSQNITLVADTENPVLVGVPSDVILTCGQAVPTAPTVTATDNCSATVTFAETQNGNVITRTWTATDGANNQVSQSQNITLVADTENPVLVGVPSDVILTCGQAVPTAPTVTATDNCSATVTFAETQNGNVITRTWTATDGAGNQVSASQNITLVADSENPVLVGVPSDVSLTCGQAVPTAPTVTATDNCGATVTFAETQNDNVITRTWTATDGANNQVSQSQNITLVADSENPVLVGVPSDVILTCGQAIPTAPTVTATDNCGATVTFAETQNDNVITRTWTATDGANNQVSQSQNITLVADTENPVLVGVPSDVILTCGQAVPTAPTVTATDNCSATVTFAETQNGNVITRTWTATDGANNQVSQSQNITIVPPVIQPTSLPILLTNVLFSEQLNLNPAVSGYTFALKVGDVLPQGLTLDGNGLLSGIPTQSGTFNFIVEATHASGCLVSQSYQLVINPNISITSFTPASAYVNQSVVITGVGFTGATAVRFNGVNAITYAINSDTQITVTVPSGASTGKISVVKGASVAESSNNFTVLICNTPPTLLPVSNLTTTSATVNWSSVSNVVGYQLRFKLASSSTWSSVLSFNASTFQRAITNLQANSLYDYQIRSMCSSTPFISSPWIAGQFSTLSPNPCATTLTLQAVSNVSSTSVTLNWTPRVGATGYEIQYKPTSSISWTSVNISNANTSTQILINLQQGTVYDYQIRAVCTSGNSPWAVSTFATTSVATIAITSFTPASAYVNQSVVITGVGFTGATAVRFHGVNAITYAINSDTQITVTVPSGASTGKISVVKGASVAESSNNFTVLICNTPPTLLPVSNLTTTSATVKWSSVSNVVGYQLRFKLASSSTWSSVLSFNASTFQRNITNLQANSLYDYQLRSMCSSTPFISSPWTAGQFSTLNVVMARIEETETNKSQIEVYPTPLENQLNIKIQSDFEGVVNFKVISLLGSVILETAVEKQKGTSIYQLDLSKLSSGVYLIQIAEGNNVTLKKVIK